LTYQNIEFSIITAERTSNPIQHRESLQTLSQVLTKLLEEFEDIFVLVAAVSHYLDGRSTWRAELKAEVSKPLTHL
jgi:hypothetical protein